MKRLLIIFLLLCSFGARSAITLVSSVNKQYSNTRVASTSINTTGASLIVVGITFMQSSGAHFSDTLGNTWTICTIYQGSGAQSGVTFYYCVNPTTSSAHYFSNGDGGGISYYGGISVFAFSGTATSSPKDQENGQYLSPPAASATPGSITPTQNDEVVLTTCMNYNGATPTMPTGYTGFNWTTGTAFAGGCGYKIQTTAAAENPSWGNMNTAGNAALNVISFKAYSAPPAATNGAFFYRILD